MMCHLQAPSTTKQKQNSVAVEPIEKLTAAHVVSNREEAWASDVPLGL